MRTLLVPLLLLVLTLNAHPALAKAGPFPPPPDLSEWSPGPAASYAAPALARDDAVRAPSGAASLRLDFTAPPHPASKARMTCSPVFPPPRGARLNDWLLAM